MGSSLALGLVYIDRRFIAEIATNWPPWLTAGPEAARQMLSAITGSMITVTGVVFSITIVSLSLASNQFSPRVLRSFMRDRVNQLVLGVLVGVFAYGLLVLQSVRSDSVVFVPQLALWCGIALSLVALGFLIAFLHHTAVSIQASEIVARLARETVHAWRTTRSLHATYRSPSPATDNGKPSTAITSPTTGYIQDIALEELEAIARRLDVTLEVVHGIGDFAIEGQALVHARGAASLAPRDRAEVQGCFGVNAYRTIDQDPAFGMRQIVDIATKALSPGINDTTTAIHCIDYLGAILHEVVHPAEKGTEVKGEDEREPSRVRLNLPDPAHFLDLGFHEIRQHARGNVSVLLRLSRSLRGLVVARSEPAAREAALKHLDLLYTAAETVPCAQDRAIVLESLRDVTDTVSRTGRPIADRASALRR